ncbi:C39 family peptidase [Streptomyces spiramyceticus]|uniref:C39 family peptidase n=1 Tax=Streptomyces spiramyceticus TaxID=299717 RepID=UPI00237A87F6|nr:C39 family peptidase [Streptomyces spiramyceticus]
MVIAPAAHAEEGPHGGIVGNYTGGDVSRPQQGKELSAQAKEKIALTDAWFSAHEGRSSKAEYAEREKTFLQKYGLDKQGAAQLNAASPYAATAAPSSRTLSLRHYGQATGYFCGPATAAMMIKSVNGSIRSRYNNNAFSQQNLANSAHMNTANARVTDWGTKKFVTGINRWRGQNWYVQVPSPTPTNAVKTMLHSIGGNGMPIAADTVEFANGRHYNGHPVNKTIGHWITAYGYTSNGSSSKWADPSTTVWNGVSKTFAYNTRNFTSYFLQSNGYAY